MTAAETAKGYFVRYLADAPTVPCPCGQSTRPLTIEDTPLCNLHVTFITDSVKHYHRETTEVYYILEGRGKMELNDDVIDVEPGQVIYIAPFTGCIARRASEQSCSASRRIGRKTSSLCAHDADSSFGAV